MFNMILLDRSVILSGLEFKSPVQLDERLAGPIEHLHDVGRETPADGEDCVGFQIFRPRLLAK